LTETKSVAGVVAIEALTDSHAPVPCATVTVKGVATEPVLIESI
jgi:hypothetical protein